VRDGVCVSLQDDSRVVESKGVVWFLCLTSNLFYISCPNFYL